MDVTRSRYRVLVWVLAAGWLAACGDEDADQGGASAAGRGSSESGTGGTGDSGAPSAAGKAGGKPAANGGGTGGQPSAAGKGGSSAAGKGGSSAAGKGGSSAAGEGGGSAAGNPGAAGSGGDSGDSGAAGAGACNLACAQGLHCELVAVTCIRAPCPAQPMCLADAGLSCDPRKVLCKRVAPECPQLQVPSVDGSCYGPCVPVEQCPCSGPSECPDSAHYTCHMSAAHCTPYL